jgi:hypothetical protein
MVSSTMFFVPQIMKYCLFLPAVYPSLTVPENAFTSLADAIQCYMSACLTNSHAGKRAGLIPSWNLTYRLVNSEADRFASPLNPKLGTEIYTRNI